MSAPKYQDYYLYAKAAYKLKHEKESQKIDEELIKTNKDLKSLLVRQMNAVRQITESITVISNKCKALNEVFKSKEYLNLPSSSQQDLRQCMAISKNIKSSDNKPQDEYNITFIPHMIALAEKTKKDINKFEVATNGWEEFTKLYNELKEQENSTTAVGSHISSPRNRRSYLSDSSMLQSFQAMNLSASSSKSFDE